MPLDRPRWADFIVQRPLLRAALHFGGGLVMGTGCYFLILWQGWLIIPVALALGGPMLYMVATQPRQKGCLFCNQPDTVMVPRVGAVVPWWMPLRSRDVSWVCQDHFTNWLRLYKPVHTPE